MKQNYKAHVSEKKKKIVNELVKLLQEYRVVGIVDMNNLPAPQLQKMRALLKGKVLIRMAKKSLMRIAFERVKDKKQNIQLLEEHLEGMPALILTNEDPFKLSRILQENMSPAPAKPGQVAPEDIVVPKGKTNFPPGPIISELGSVGIKAGIEGGKVAIKEDAVVVKKGEVINAKVASVLSRLGIEPMKVGLRIVAAYDNGEIFKADVLRIDTEQVLDNMKQAASMAYYLALGLNYPTKETIQAIITRTYQQAKQLALETNYLTKETVGIVLAKAENAAKLLSEKVKPAE